MSEGSPHQYLFENLVVLNEFKPGGSDFVKCIKDDMFTKPNRTAFDQVLFYLCNTYDSANYMAKVPWPILDRSQERVFKQNTVAFVKEIIKDSPEARIPSFSPSFLSTPGGERLAKFMWKFSLFVLRTLIEREGDVIGLLHYPRAPAVLPLIDHITESNLQYIGKESDDLCQLIIDASKYSKKLSNEILNQAMEKNRMKNELSEMIQNMEDCPLSQMEKATLLTSDREHFLSLVNKWQHHLNTEAEVGKSMLKGLQNQSSVILECHDSVQILVNSKTMPIVLDASLFPANLKDDNGNVDLAELMSEAACTASNLLKTLSMFGGFQSYEHVLPELENVRKQLQEAETSMVETKAGFIDLLSASLENAKSPKNSNGGTESPLLKGGLQMGYEMLQDAQTNTPPMVFDVRCDTLSRITTESSPVGGLRPFPRVKANTEVDSTPKASVSNSSSGIFSRNLSGKVSLAKSFSLKDNNVSKGSPKSTNRDLIPVVAETPANFCPKKFSTSTAHKPAFVLPSHKTKLGLAGLSHASDKTKSLQTLNEISPLKSHGLKTGIPLTTKSRNVSKVFPASSLISKEIGGNLHSSKKEDAEVCQLQVPSAKQGHLKKLGPQKNLGNTSLPSPSEQTTKQVACSSSSPLMRKTDSDPMTSNQNSLKHLRPSQESVSSSSLTSLLDTTPKNKPSNISKHDTCNVIPKVVVNAVGDSCLDTFDSPQSSSFGAFSPPSADNSFFSTDMQTDMGEPPKFDLDAFGDDISPSGRVSLCPSDVETNEVITETLAPAKENSRRKSLQAIIHRYRELVASSKQHEVQVVPPSSPEIEATDEDFVEDLDLDSSFSEMNLL